MNSTTAAAATSSVLSTLTRRLTHLSLQSSAVSKRHLTVGVGSGAGSGSGWSSSTLTSTPSLIVAGKSHKNGGTATTSTCSNLSTNIVNNQLKLKTSNNSSILSSLSSSLVNSRAFSTSSTGDKPGSSDDRDAEWNKFQQTLIFDEAKLSGSLGTKTKKRGGKMLRRKKAKELELMEKGKTNTDVGGGRFPSMRYSDEETEKLLKEAYDGLPQKGISKKTRQIKRMRNRFKAIRKARYIKKQEKIAHHFARMEKRSLVVKEVKLVKESAAEIREKDLMYQREVLLKWAEIQGLTAVTNDTQGAVSADDGVENKEEKM